MVGAMGMIEIGTKNEGLYLRFLRKCNGFRVM